MPYNTDLHIHFLYKKSFLKIFSYYINKLNCRELIKSSLTTHLFEEKVHLFQRQILFGTRIKKETFLLLQFKEVMTTNFQIVLGTKFNIS